MPSSASSSRAERQRLAALAGHEDAAWNRLVLLLTPAVDADLEHLELVPEEEDHVRRAVWRGLARRLELGNPPSDILAWIRQRTVIEAGRRPRMVLLTDVPERRVLAERRRHDRPGRERRTVDRITPDSLAARLRHRR